jgi:hypothetical protein
MIVLEHVLYISIARTTKTKLDTYLETTTVSRSRETRMGREQRESAENTISIAGARDRVGRMVLILYREQPQRRGCLEQYSRQPPP